MISDVPDKMIKVACVVSKSVQNNRPVLVKVVSKPVQESRPVLVTVVKEPITTKTVSVRVIKDIENKINNRRRKMRGQRIVFAPVKHKQVTCKICGFKYDMHGSYIPPCPLKRQHYELGFVDSRGRKTGKKYSDLKVHHVGWWE